MAIEGIKLVITSIELKSLCEKRVEYHSQRAEWNRNKVKELEPTFKEAAEHFADESESQLKYGNSNSYGGNKDALDGFKSSARHHRDRATVFRFMSEHVIANETYILGENDLMKLEVIKPF